MKIYHFLFLGVLSAKGGSNLASQISKYQRLSGERLDWSCIHKIASCLEKGPIWRFLKCFKKCDPVIEEPEKEMCKDGIYRHPKHCSGFYHCLGGVEFPVQFCQTGLLFNPTIAACDWPKNVDCKNQFVSGECYEDNKKRILPIHIGDFSNNQKSVCIDACQGYKYAGVQYTHQCFCGNDTPSASLIRSEECTILCPGNQSEFCGDGWRMNVYETTDIVESTNMNMINAAVNDPTCHDGVHEKPITSRKDCSGFYHCANGRKWEQYCPGNLAFNPDIQVCDYLDNVCAANNVANEFKTNCCQ